MRRALRRGANVAVLALALLAVPTAVGQAATAHQPTTPIRHLVIMTQDQHSFDNYLGARPGVDGLPHDVCLPKQETGPALCVAPFPLKDSTVKPTLRATATAQETSVANGRMDGFVLAQRTRYDDGRAAMGFYRPTDLPVLTQLADQGIVFDRWFSSVPGGSIANRLFAFSGRAVQDTELVPEGGWPDLPMISDRLEAVGVSWKVYVEHYEPALTVTTAGRTARGGGQVARVPLLALHRYEQDSGLLSHITDLSTYYSDLSTGALPAVSWIVTTSSSERSPGDPVRGQRELHHVVNALGESYAWPHAAFLLSYDSSGGWYDHVRPPTRQGERLGLRVPAVLVSPYARRGSVNHTPLDSASVLRFIESNWALAPLAPRDAAAPDLASALALDQAPHAYALVGTTGDRPPPPDPNRAIIYVSYLMALLLVAGIVSWAALGRRHTSALTTPEPA